jgi:hypothetical protein
MSMNSGQTTTVSEFSRSRPVTEPSNKPHFRTAVRNVIARVRSWLGKLFSFAFVRVLLIFLVGFAAGIAWQSYDGTARKAIASWSPHLAWVAPASAPASSSVDRLKATSLALTAVRQSVDKLSAEISKLQPEDGASQRRRR